MAEIDYILQEYAEMRTSGVNAKEALRRLRPEIEPLAKDTKDRLVTAIRAYESENSRSKKPTTSSESAQRSTPQAVASGVKPLKPKTEAEPTPVSAIEADSKAKGDRVFCWNCGKPNRKGEVICVHCGSLMNTASTTNAATKQLVKDDFQPEAFRATSTLNLGVSHNSAVIELRPQDQDHETIVGRADSKGVISPDVDLSAHGGSQMGVSRMHMSIGFDAENERIIITDMGSVNGLFVNGQRLANKEDRVLRHGDQLRLGELVLNVSYKHQN